jgi:hypothetical protein
MDVKEILKLLATLSIGLDDIDVESDNPSLDVIVFMRYINQAYTEILQSTLAESPFVRKRKESVNCNDGDCDATEETIFLPITVYDVESNSPLLKTTYEEILKIDPGFTKEGVIPEKWFYWNGIISVYPIVTSLLADGKGIGVAYIPQPDLLTKDSESADIAIPAMYQSLLVDGASYYLFQSETGFKDQLKMQAAMKRWEDGKQKLFAYMKNFSGKQYYSTYSAV